MRLLARGLLTALFFTLALGTLQAAPEGSRTLNLRNAEAQAVFYWWASDRGRTFSVSEVLALLPLGGPLRADPGDRVKVTLGPGQTLVGAFVNPGATWLTPVSGGFLTPSPWPAQGTVVLTASVLAAAQGGRPFTAPLQAWGLAPGRFSWAGGPWDQVPALAEWGPAALWGTAPGRLTRLQAVHEGEDWWVRAEGLWPAGASLSLVLQGPGGLLEIPLEGTDRTVRLFSGSAAYDLGRSAPASGAATARWSLDRLPDDLAAAWAAARGSWALAWSAEGVPRTLELTGADLGALP